MSGPLSFRKRKRSTGDVVERRDFERAADHASLAREIETNRKNRRNVANWLARFKRDPLTDAVPRADKHLTWIEYQWHRRYARERNWWSQEHD